MWETTAQEASINGITYPLLVYGLRDNILHFSNPWAMAQMQGALSMCVSRRLDYIHVMSKDLPTICEGCVEKAGAINV